MLTAHLRWWQAHHKRECAARGEPSPSEEDIRQLYLNKDVAVPDLTTMKDFVRFLAALGDGRIKKDDDRVTTDSLCTTMEFFFAAFEKATETIIDKYYRSEIYNVRYLNGSSLLPSLQLTDLSGSAWS